MSLSLDRLAQILGAVAPVVAVSGMIIASKIVDPPETSKERVVENRLARRVCSEATDYLLTSLYDAMDAVESFLAATISKDALSRDIMKAAESIEIDMKRFYEKVSGISPALADAVKKVFSPELIKYMVGGLRSLAEFVRTYYSDSEIYSTATSEIEGWIKHVMDLYCECLIETGAKICRK